MALNPCDETYRIGPFLFECAGHNEIELSLLALGRMPLLEHRSRSPQMAGDAEVTWWTETPVAEAQREEENDG